MLQLVTSNDLTISDYGPFAALQADLGRSLTLYAGVRRDEIQFANTDKLIPSNSYTKTPGITSPKASVTWGKEQGEWLPQPSFSFGKAFHANDPRIGSGTDRGALIIQSREYQLIAGKVFAGTELRVTLAHQTNSEELAKIDPDTGLRQDIGPSIKSLRHGNGAPALRAGLPAGPRTHRRTPRIACSISQFRRRAAHHRFHRNRRAACLRQRFQGRIRIRRREAARRWVSRGACAAGHSC